MISAAARRVHQLMRNAKSSAGQLRAGILAHKLKRAQSSCSLFLDFLGTKHHPSSALEVKQNTSSKHPCPAMSISPNLVRRLSEQPTGVRGAATKGQNDEGYGDREGNEEQ